VGPRSVTREARCSIFVASFVSGLVCSRNRGRIKGLSDAPSEDGGAEAGLRPYVYKASNFQTRLFPRCFSPVVTPPLLVVGAQPLLVRANTKRGAAALFPPPPFFARGRWPRFPNAATVFLYDGWVLTGGPPEAVFCSCDSAPARAAWVARPAEHSFYVRESCIRRPTSLTQHVGPECILRRKTLGAFEQETRFRVLATRTAKVKAPKPPVSSRLRQRWFVRSASQLACDHPDGPGRQTARPYKGGGMNPGFRQ